MNYIHQLLNSPESIQDKSMIIRHHNGDLCNNVKEWVKITSTGIEISEEWKFKNTKQELGITGHYIKWLKKSNLVQSPTKSKVPAYVSFPRNMLQKYHKNPESTVPINDMIFVQANDSSATIEVQEIVQHDSSGNKKKLKLVPPTIKKNFFSRKESKDTSNHNSYRSKVSTERNLYQSRYDDQELIKSLKTPNFKIGRARINSDVESKSKSLFL